MASTPLVFNWKVSI
ncbi:hypothetical protein [Plasmodium yoelii yoelii]|uniref:Uncharacterized protein n=1 Tax=Plasmodium yoelii yoelii TaxID=73239 RepID=Q7RLM6_PLAYO|nr:hypothetical protein [Plasmodium yoelii yoelii]